MKTITITIKGQQDHINQRNKSESFINESKAREFLLGQLESLNYSQDEPVTLNDGDYYDTGDYTVSVDVSSN